MNKIVIYLLFTFFFLSAESLSAQDDKKKDKEEDLTVLVTPTNYEEVIAKGVVFVDYWAAWCGPCRRMNPILKELASERKGKVVIGKLNVDHFQEFTENKRVYNLPTIIIYKDGKEITRAAGLIPKQKLLEVVDYLLSAD